MDYQSYLKNKSQTNNNFGFEPIFMPDFLFDFQKHIVEWNLLKGRSATFADCGLGKSPMSLVWAENVIRKTNGKVLLCTPLSVSQQFIKESEKFGIEAHRSKDGTPKSNITITNYERLHLFNPVDFTGFVSDESSILKNFKGKIKNTVTEFIKKMNYRLLCTATASPNDFIELGTSSEALGYMGFMDMLNCFFKNDTNNSAIGRKYGEVVKYVFRSHAKEKFWQWVSSWAKAIRKPSDLGFQDDKFILPSLFENNVVINCSKPLPGKLFVEAAKGWREQKQEVKQTIKERCEKAAELCQNHEYSVIWCHLNDEGDTLEKIIPDAKEIHGRLKDDAKEELYQSFSDGQIKKLIIKPKMGAFGLNWQHCNHSVYFISHSYEQYYQGIRRFYRFGQKKDVVIDRILTPGLESILQNLNRKSNQADEMFDKLIEYMNNSINMNIDRNYTKKEMIPNWIN